jgi:hypothetical protein
MYYKIDKPEKIEKADTIEEMYGLYSLQNIIIICCVNIFMIITAYI